MSMPVENVKTEMEEVESFAAALEAQLQAAPEVQQLEAALKSELGLLETPRLAPWIAAGLGCAAIGVVGVLCIMCRNTRRRGKVYASVRPSTGDTSGQSSEGGKKSSKKHHKKAKKKWKPSRKSSDLEAQDSDARDSDDDDQRRLESCSGEEARSEGEQTSSEACSAMRDTGELQTVATDLDPPQPTNGVTANAGAITVGATVRVHGLKAAPEHNGKIGVVQGEGDRKKDQNLWNVRCPDGERLCVKERNLVKLASSSPAVLGAPACKTKRSSNKAFEPTPSAAGDELQMEKVKKRSDHRTSDADFLAEDPRDAQLNDGSKQQAHAPTPRASDTVQTANRGTTPTRAPVVPTFGRARGAAPGSAGKAAAGIQFGARRP